jgi:hypothetical protein
MTDMDRAKASRARLQLLRSEEARHAQIEQLLGVDVLVEGSFVSLGRRCGKPTCRCATGEKHYSKFLSRSEAGRTRLVYVPSGDELDIARKAELYRRFRHARAALMKLSAETAQWADALQEALTETYPPQPPAATPKRRRIRKSEGDGDS